MSGEGRLSRMQAVADLRRAAAIVVALCDAAIFGAEGDRARAVRALLADARRLAARLAQTLTSLEEL